MGAVRMTNRGKWVSEKAQRYMDYKTAVRIAVRKQFKAVEPLQTPIRIKEIVYVMPVPKRGRAARKVDGRVTTRTVKPGDYHLAKPDIDNLFKGLTDALNGVVWEDDKLICEIGRQVKIYGDPPRIEIEIEEVSA